MNRNSSRILCLTVSVLLVVCMLGCATNAYRFYSGLPLPGNEIALAWGVSGCRITYLHDEREKEEKLLFSYGHDNTLFDLLPGQYISGITYRSPSGSFIGGRVQLKLNVQAGNIYIIYPEITGPWGNQTWRPIFVNINYYNKEDCEKYNGRGSCPDKDEISKWTTEYLQSERRTMSYYPLEKPRVEDFEGVRRVYNGYWF